MNLSGMNLIELEPNLFKDVDTDTTFRFLFNYDLTLMEADRRIYAHYRWWHETVKKVRPDLEFYGQPHVILQTGDVSGLRGSGEFDSEL